jgi:hypothetical protein
MPGVVPVFCRTLDYLLLRLAQALAIFRPWQSSHSMFVKAFNNFADLQTYHSRWDELAGDCVFRSWAWQSTWWKHYEANHQLKVLLVFVDESSAACATTSTCQPLEPTKLVGILPLYAENSHTLGQMLRLLGDGEVCSEHLDLLCESHHASEVALALTEYLSAHADDWDCLSAHTVAENDRHLGLLITTAAEAGCEVVRAPGVNLWSIPLPATWEEFLAMQSKSHRKQLRQMKSRVLESERAHWLPVAEMNQFELAWDRLIDLHQLRRESLGEPGCFASAPWANFHREVAQELLSAGQLRLSVLELDGQPVAAEYHLASSTATFAYQGGLDPDRRDDEPGQLSMILCVERAIAEGHQRFELLRGDEPYKAHWRAEPTPTVEVTVVSPRTISRLRHYSWNSIRRAGRFVRQFANLLS